MGIVNSRPTRSSFAWKPVPLTMRQLGQLYEPIIDTDVNYMITKPVYDLMFKTSFVQQKILDALSEKMNEQFTLKRRFEVEYYDGVPNFINTYKFESPSDANVRQDRLLRMSIELYNIQGEKRYLVWLSCRNTVITDIANTALVAALNQAKATFEAHVSERNSLVALALTGKDDTRRGEALEIFARNYYPESIRTVSGARVDVDSSSIPALASQYSRAMRNPRIDEVLFNR